MNICTNFPPKVARHARNITLFARVVVLLITWYFANTGEEHMKLGHFNIEKTDLVN